MISQVVCVFKVGFCGVRSSYLLFVTMREGIKKVGGNETAISLPGIESA